MKVLLDTNIVLDYILNRNPFFEHSSIIFKWAYDRKITAFISASAITDIYYLVQRSRNSETALDFIEEIIQFIQIAGVDKTIILSALHSGIKDFEDAVQNASAENVGIKYIITRNIADFKNSKIQISSPLSFIETLN
ncbi:MAG: PIN domain-containing protein [Chlorobi bacterium]|nr:PIN domain-containing protein [Chlorobiota bacterium]